MRRALLAALALALAAGCTESAEPAGRLDGPSRAEAQAGQTTPSPGERTFGTAPDETRPLTALSSIVAAPERFRDQVVRTEGEIAQVCQRMGCWIELRENAGGPSVRVPMAGHSFFLPRDVAGRRATLEGRVAVEALSPDARAHLESEGAAATTSALAIHATGVVVR